MPKSFHLAAVAGIVVGSLCLGTPVIRAQEPPERAACANNGGSRPWQTAIAACTEIIEAGRDFDRVIALAYVYRASAYINIGNNEQAVTDSNKAIEIDPLSAPAFSMRSGAYVNLREFDRALVTQIQR